MKRQADRYFEMLVTDNVCCFFNCGCIFILITLIFLYNVVSSREDTEVSASDEDDGEPEDPEPEPAVSSTAFASPRGPSGRSTYLKPAS